MNSKRHKEAVGDGDVLEGVVTASGEPFTLETTAASAGGARPHAHQGQGHRGAVPEGVVFDRRGAPGYRFDRFFFFFLLLHRLVTSQS